MKLYVTELEFLNKTFCPPKIGEIDQKAMVFGCKETLKEIDFKFIFTEFVL